MAYFKLIKDGYIDAIGTGNGGTEITQSEYDEIMTVISNKPQTTEDTDYRLKEDLTWESYHVEPSPESDPDPEEALSILLGGVEV